MRAAITGVNGFVGGHLVAELVAHDIDVIGIDHAPTPTSLVSKKLSSYHSANLVDSCPDLAEVDAVVHLAGLSRVGPSFSDPQRYIHENSAMVTNLFEGILNQDLSVRILVVSSGAVYESSQPLPIDEGGLVSASSPYVVSKLLVENQAAYYILRGLDALVVRPFNHFGPGQRSGFILPDLTQNALWASRNNVPIGVGDLSTRRDYTDVRDIVRAYRLLLEANAPAHRVFNVSSGSSIAGSEMLSAVQSALQTDLPIEVDPSRFRPTDDRVVVGSSLRLETVAGWRPEIGFEQTVADYVQWAKQRRE